MRVSNHIGKCSACYNSCFLKKDLKKHVEGVHEKKKPHKCSIWNFSSYHIESVYEGRKSHSTKSPRDEKAAFKEKFWLIRKFVVFYVEVLVFNDKSLALPTRVRNLNASLLQ